VGQARGFFDKGDQARGRQPQMNRIGADFFGNSRHRSVNARPIESANEALFRLEGSFLSPLICADPVHLRFNPSENRVFLPTSIALVFERCFGLAKGLVFRNFLRKRFEVSSIAHWEGHPMHSFDVWGEIGESSKDVRPWGEM
jgi:hypothetical protein